MHAISLDKFQQRSSYAAFGLRSAYCCAVRARTRTFYAASGVTLILAWRSQVRNLGSDPEGAREMAMAA